MNHSETPFMRPPFVHKILVLRTEWSPKRAILKIITKKKVSDYFYAFESNEYGRYKVYNKVIV